MEIGYAKQGHVSIFTISGRIDSATSPELEKAIFSVVKNDTHQVLLDFSKVDYLSSAGIRILVLCHKEMEKKGGKIFLTNLSKPIEHTLYLTGFLPYFQVFDTQNEALELIAGTKE